MLIITIGNEMLPYFCILIWPNDESTLTKRFVTWKNFVHYQKNNCNQLRTEKKRENIQEHFFQVAKNPRKNVFAGKRVLKQR